MVGFLRSVCKKSFFAKINGDKLHEKTMSKRILLTRPTNLFYEQYIFSYYLQIVRFIRDQLYRVATLEEDFELLQRGEPGNDLEPIDFEFRMAVVYRAEKKKILLSQINLVQKIVQILRHCEDILNNPEETDKSRAFTEMVLKETPAEVEWRS